MSGAKAFIEALKRENVKLIFGLPGGAILPVYDALYDDGEIRHVLARHEQGAAHMADAYARVSGRVGVCMVTSGPGATNTVTGIAVAHMDSSPMVTITGQVATSMIGRDAFQEADIVGITTPITKETFQPRKAREVPRIVKAAFYIASTGRPGPVLIDLPRDVQTEECEMEFPEKVELLGYRVKMEPDPLQVRRAVEALMNAEKPIIIAGGGVILSNASHELRSLSEHLMIPVATTLMGKGAMPENHPLCLGMIGMHGRYEANKLVTEADVILAVGTRFSDRSTGKFSEFAQDARIIHVDIDPAEISKNVPAHIPIICDAKIGLSMILEEAKRRIKKSSNSKWVKRIEEVKEEARSVYDLEGDLKPGVLMKMLRKMLPENAIVTTGVGQNQMWAALFFDVYHPRTFITSGGLGAMGFGFPAAVGARAAAPDRVVVDVDGDGSFMMTGKELATSVAEELPVIAVILNNGWLGMVKQWQCLFYGKRYIATNLKGNPDFAKLAEVYGAQGFTVYSYDDFESAMSESLGCEVSSVIDVKISPDEKVFPFVPPGKSLKEMILHE
ncbi:MAG: biosynthetic-type acetolactate synthase large subunit [Candidatus Jordarchaeales archaeon]|nr:biosynthetic-type acetolactate synthase large subunit [Candidatus Jordarchaeia archaeon]